MAVATDCMCMVMESFESLVIQLSHLSLEDDAPPIWTPISPASSSEMDLYEMDENENKMDEDKIEVRSPPSSSVIRLSHVSSLDVKIFDISAPPSVTQWAPVSPASSENGGERSDMEEEEVCGPMQVNQGI